MRMFQVLYFYKTLLCKNIDFSLSFSITQNNNNTMAPALSREAHDLAMAIVSDGIELFLAKEFRRDELVMDSAQRLEDRVIGHIFEYYAKQWKSDLKDCGDNGERVFYRRLVYNGMARKYGDYAIVEELGRAFGAFDEGIDVDLSCKCPFCAGEASPEWEEYVNADVHDHADPYFSTRSGDYGTYVWSSEDGWFDYMCNEFGDDIPEVATESPEVATESPEVVTESPEVVTESPEVAPDEEIDCPYTWRTLHAFIAARELLNLLADSKSGEFWDMSSSCSSVQALITDWDEALMSKLRT